MTECLWAPSKARISTSRLATYMKKSGPFEGYDALWEWSVKDRAAFWLADWDFYGVVGRKGETILTSGDRMLEAREGFQMHAATQTLQAYAPDVTSFIE